MTVAVLEPVAQRAARTPIQARLSQIKERVKNYELSHPERGPKAVIKLQPGDIEIIWRPNHKFPTPRLRWEIFERMLEGIGSAYLTGLQNVKDTIIAANPYVHVGKTARALQYRLSMLLGKFIPKIFPDLILLKPEERLIRVVAKTHNYPYNSYQHTDKDNVPLVSIEYTPPCSGRLIFNENYRILPWQKFTPEGQDLPDYQMYFFLNDKLQHGSHFVPEGITHRFVQTVDVFPANEGEFTVDSIAKLNRQLFIDGYYDVKDFSLYYLQRGELALHDLPKMPAAA